MTLASLSADQLEFLALHVKRAVFLWKWHFRDAMLRAESGRFKRSICRTELEDLIARGLMFRGAGAADVHPTATGRELIA